MGDPKGFISIKRKEAGYRPMSERIQDYSEVEKKLPDKLRKLQAARCMDCGVPFCQWGCPVGNIMPEFQNMMFKDDWKSAYEILQKTNNFPEFTGRVCPAPCESACVVSIDDDAVTIRQNELAVIEKAFKKGYVIPHPPAYRTGKKVAVIGGGPAGLACADLLNREGHIVVLFEEEDNVGGYLRFGIPDFKLDKHIIDRRVDILIQEGLIIKTKTKIGRDISFSDIKKDFDAVCIAIGARKPRDLNIKGRNLKGVHFAMEYLLQQNKIVRGDIIPEDKLIRALDKNVIVIGGGDTGSDCVGTAIRQGARKIIQLELMPKLPLTRSDAEPWPLFPRLHKTSSSHEEGCERKWNILTKKFSGKDGHIKSVQAAEVRWTIDKNGRHTMAEKHDTEFDLDADLVLLAMGFEHVIHEGITDQLNLKMNLRGNIHTDEHLRTNCEGIFAAGDSVRGASLVVHAINDGREAAKSISSYLSGHLTNHTLPE